MKKLSVAILCLLVSFSMVSSIAYADNGPESVSTDNNSESSTPSEKDLLDGEIQGVYIVNEDGSMEETTLGQLELSGEDDNSDVIARDDQPDKRPIGSCKAGWVYRGKKEKTSFYNIVTGTVVYNYTSKNATLKSSIGKDTTLGTVVNGELSGGWGPVQWKAGISANASVTWTKSEDTTITIRPNYKGWNQYGTQRTKWSGPYVYVDRDCNQSNSHNVTVYSPKGDVILLREKKFR
ncbi:hypothetical protein [Marininema halotolerans]|uniref:Uncharacterized protein n=1 Tax=Marininema halotolerans TaxID=1155944 RepID=A0A1I6QJQ8_9BACL|nr:hypothetical protein [Marininema halotolerans]SFS52681.1 hypothetical protein SAMN05444972_103196 [Marininema halotolerans]